MRGGMVVLLLAFQAIGVAGTDTLATRGDFEQGWFLGLAFPSYVFQSLVNIEPSGPDAASWMFLAGYAMGLFWLAVFINFVIAGNKK